MGPATWKPLLRSGSGHSTRSPRGGSLAADPQQQIVVLRASGRPCAAAIRVRNIILIVAPYSHRQTPGHGAGSRRRGPQGGDPASHVGRWQRVPLRQAGRSHLMTVETFQFSPDRAEPRCSRGDDGLIQRRAGQLVGAAADTALHVGPARLVALWRETEMCTHVAQLAEASRLIVSW